jgi:hypothetical protein
MQIKHHEGVTMPVQITWYIPERILLAIYSGDVSREDIQHQYQEGIKLCHSVDTPLVHMIVDTAGVKSFPKTISDYKGTFGEKARNAGWVVLVGDNKIARLLCTVVTNLMKLRFAYVTTVEEAIFYISERDKSFTYEEAMSKTYPIR